MTASTATAPADEVTPYARKALIASTAGYAMDGFDFLILGFMLTAIRADLGLSQSEAASLATWTLLGAVAGGIGFGILVRPFGRVRVLTWTILLFAVFTGLSRARAGLLGPRALPRHRRARARRRVRHRHGARRRSLAGRKARARVSSYVGLGWQAGVLARGARHAAAASGDRLARHVRRRARAGARLVPDPPRRRRAAAVRRAGEGRKSCDAHHGALAPPGEGRRDREDQPRHAHPLLGAELRLLRHHDLDAGLSGDASSASACRRRRCGPR